MQGFMFSCTQHVCGILSIATTSSVLRQVFSGSVASRSPFCYTFSCSINEDSGRFKLWDVVDESAMNIVHKSLCGHRFSFLLANGLLGHRV